VRVESRWAPAAERSSGDDGSKRLAGDLARIHAELEYWETHVTGRIENKEAEAELTRRLHDLESLLTDDNCAEIARSLSTRDLQSPFGLAALRRWLAIDPVAAAHDVGARPDATDDTAFLVADTLVEHPADLLELWRQSPDSIWVQKVLQHAAGTALVVDPRAAIELSNHLAPSDNRTELLGQIAQHWARSEPAAAKTWAESIADPATRDAVIVAAASGLVSSDPLGAIDWLTRKVADEATRKTALEQTIAGWAASDLDTAQHWVETLADQKLRAIAAPIIANLRSQ
jgi:hypothetical protein